MPLFDSLNINATSFDALNKKFETTGENIANAGTTGFKKSQSEFNDIFVNSMMGKDGGIQNGSGVVHSGDKLNMSQGDILSSRSSLDLAINGKGMIPVETPFGQAFTRDGSLRFDKNGNLTNSDGYKVLAYQSGRDGKISSSLTPVNIQNLKSPVSATSQVDLLVNLDARVGPKVFDVKNPNATSDFLHGVEVTDSKGVQRTLNVFFNKVSNNQWEYHVCADGKMAKGGTNGVVTEFFSGKLNFDNKGRLESQSQSAGTVNINDSEPLNISFNFGTPYASEGDPSKGSSQVGIDSSIQKSIVNGQKEGAPDGLHFNNEGVLSASFENGEFRDIAQIALGTFSNEQGLRKIGQNLYITGKNSGQASIGKPGVEERGEIRSSSIEMSNVDVSQEFIEMMKTQKSYGASAKAYGAIDEMIKTTINMKS